MDELIRTGTVTAVSGRSVRVHFPEDGIVSDWLKVVQNSDTGFMPTVGDSVLCIYASGFNADGYVIGVI
ncbi:MAG: hypothetical protein ACI4F5_06540 [Acutalibacteraceae bacterium]